MTIEPIFHSPTPAEMAGRLARVQQRMAEEKLDWYVCFSPDNVYYLTNFANFVHERPFLLLVPANGAPSFICPKLELPHIASRKVGEIELVDYFEFPAPEGKAWHDRLRAVIGKAGRVGVESVCQLQVFDVVPGERVRTDIVDDLRMIKSPYELSRLVHAAGIANEAMADLLANAAVGRSLSAVMAAGKALMMGRLIGDNPAINPFATRADVVFQPPSISDDPHNFSNLAMAMEAGGPHVSVINAVLNGYGTEVERTFFLGSVPEAAKAPFEVMMQARALAFDLCKPGTPMNDVDAAVNALLRKAGYTPHMLHRTGHGMGVTGHEGPFLAEGEHRILEPGMCLTIEPGVYPKGVGGFRHSDTILITETGNLCLTQAPETIEALTL
jgi:Xaa-Pro dipeptidase